MFIAEFSQTPDLPHTTTNERHYALDIVPGKPVPDVYCTDYRRYCPETGQHSLVGKGGKILIEAHLKLLLPRDHEYN